MQELNHDSQWIFTCASLGGCGHLHVDAGSGRGSSRGRPSRHSDGMAQPSRRRQPVLRRYVKHTHLNYYARAEPASPANPHQLRYHIQKLDTFGATSSTGQLFSLGRSTPLFVVKYVLPGPMASFSRGKLHPCPKCEFWHLRLPKCVK